jgi:hypothetical protein
MSRRYAANFTAAGTRPNQSGTNRSKPDNSLTARYNLRMMKRLALIFACAGTVGAQTTRTRNVVLIVTDGLRWQEVFRGADTTLRRDSIVRTSEERRRELMPFLWNTVAREGQLFGNQSLGSAVQITNGLKFSYPGYNEILTGVADPRIRSNSFGRNPNRTLLDWFAAKPGFAGRVAAYGTWTVFNDIFDRQRAAFPVHAGWDPPVAQPRNSADSLLNRLYLTSHREFHDVAWDALMQTAVLREIQLSKPRLLFVGYGETDEWAHAGRYGNVLSSAHAVDAFIAELWRTMQAMPEYRDSTTFIITTDHGRGSGSREWRDHGEKIQGAEDIWLAVLGPDTPPLGERTNVGRVTQSQIAATIAALLGEDYLKAMPAAGAPLRDVVKLRAGSSW